MNVYTGAFVKYRTSSADLRLSANTALGSLNVKVYGNWLNALITTTDPVYPRYPADNIVYVGQLRDIFKLGSSHTFRVSVDYRYNSMATTPVGGAHVFYDVLSGSAMWNWKIDDAWSLTNAIRIDSLSLGRDGVIPAGLGLVNADWNRRRIDELSFNSGLVWQPDGSNTLRISMARGIQLPKLAEFGGFLISTPFGFVGGIPSLKPAIVTNYELGWDGKFLGGGLTAGIRLFHQTTRDVISNFGANLPAANFVIAPFNIGHSETSGVELIAKGQFGDGWRWGLSYTPQWIHDHFAAGYTVATTLLDYEHTKPVHVVDGNLGWSRGPWEVDGYFRFESEFSSIRSVSPTALYGYLVSIPEYVSADARIAYRITDHLTLALSGQNLLQSPQRQTSASEVERRVYVTASVDF